MDPYERRRGLHVTHDERDSLLDSGLSIGAEFSAKSVNAKLAPASGEVGRSYLARV